jgi:hypothetical protein
LAGNGRGRRPAAQRWPTPPATAMHQTSGRIFTS